MQTRKGLEKRGLDHNKRFRNVELAIVEKVSIETTTSIINIKYYMAQ